MENIDPDSTPLESVDRIERTDKDRQEAAHIKGLLTSLLRCYPCIGEDTSESIVSHILGLFWNHKQTTETDS